MKSSRIFSASEEFKLARKLFLAAKRGDVDDVHRLLDAGASYQIRFNENNEDQLDQRYGIDAFYIAAKNGRTEIVKIFLDKGIDVNETYGPIYSTSLHAAVTEDHIDIVKLLIDYKANVNIEDDYGRTPINLHSLQHDPKIESILIAAGAKKTPSLKQITLLKNYNFICRTLTFYDLGLFVPIDAAGLCDGTAKVFILYAHQGRIDEFIFYFHYLNHVSHDDLQTLIKEFKQHRRLNTFNIGDNYSLDKLIEFMRAINDAQITQRTTYFKSIGANWDATNIIACPASQLNYYLKSCGITEWGSEKNQYKIFFMGDHSMALFNHHDTWVAYYFDSNFNAIVLCHNEDELAAALYKTLIKIQRDTVRFVICDLSYGDANRELDDILKKFETTLTHYPETQNTFTLYKNGHISRRDTAFTLQQQLLRIASHSDEFDFLNNELQGYLVKHPLKSAMPLATDVNQFMDKYHQTLLHATCSENSLQLSQMLIALGSNIHATNTSNRTPLKIAKDRKNEELILFLEQQESVNDIVFNSGLKDTDSLPIKISKLFDSYAHPPFLSFHWRDHRELADSIARYFEGNPKWNEVDCREELAKLTRHIEFFQLGSFAGIIQKANQLIHQSIEDKKPKDESYDPRQYF